MKDYLVAQRKALPHARIIFIRRRERRALDGLCAFVAHASVGDRQLRRLDFERYDDLIGLDLRTAGVEVEHPLFLVCTHGKHDRCCARYGRPLYNAVCEQVDEGWAWQSSHIGGDRFAGNLVTLPDGVYYGRVDPSEAWAVVEAALEGRVYLPCYRGRSCYGFAAQAAELAVREATGLLGVDEVVVRRIEGDGERWHAEVEAGGTVHDGRRAPRGGRPHAPHLLDVSAQAAEPLRRRIPSRTSLLSSTRRPASSRPPGSCEALKGPSLVTTNSSSALSRSGKRSRCPSKTSVVPCRSAMTVSRRSS